MTIAWNDVLQRRPLIAILRGLRPEEAVEVGEALLAAGFLCLEVPLNSPEPMRSIRALREALEGRALVGAGTVLTADRAREALDAGSQIVIAPNVNPEVIGAAKRAGAVALPGFFTPTEAFQAIDAGADALKLFPAEGASPAYLRAARAVIGDIPVFPVGGVDGDQFGAWVAAGASGFGLGGALYKPGMSAAEAGARAARLAQAWDALA